MTWLLAEHSRFTRFHEGDRDTLADAYRAYVAGLSAWLTDAARTEEEPERAVSALAVDDLAVLTLERAFERDRRRAFIGPQPFAHTLTPLALDALRSSSVHALLVDEGVAHRGHTVSRALHDAVFELARALPRADAELFALRFVDDRLRRDAAAKTSLSPHVVRERERVLRRALLGVVVDVVDARTRPSVECVPFVDDMVRLLVDGEGKRVPALLAHARACARCRSVYDGFARFEPTDAARDLAHGFRADVDMDAPPRLLARVRETMPDDASEEVPMYARASGHLVSLIALTLAAMLAVALVTREEDGASNVHVTTKPMVTLRVACTTEREGVPHVAVVDESAPALPDDSITNHCVPKGALYVTAHASSGGRAVALVDGASAFGPTSLEEGVMRALDGAFPLTDVASGAVVVRLVFVEGAIDDSVLAARAEHPLPHDVVVEQRIPILRP